MPHTIPLTHLEAFERLTQAITRDAPDYAWSEEEQETLTEIVGILDGQPRALDAVAEAITSSSVRQVYTRLKHGLLSDILDPDAWGFVWQDFGAAHQRVLCAAASCGAGCDVESIAGIARVEEPEHVLDELVGQAWLTALEDGSGWHMSWSIRQLVMMHIEDVHTWRATHAQHFLTRFEREDAVTSPFDEPNLEHALAFGMSHDSDITARSTLALYYIRRQSHPAQELITMLEAAITRRPCAPGDMLGVELLGRLGELYRNIKHFEKSVETLELALALAPPVDGPLYGGLHMALALGLSYCGRLQQAREMAIIAMESYTRLALHSHARDALSTLATIHVHEHDYEAAADVFSRLVESEPSSLSTRTNLGAVNVALGHCELARTCLDHVLSDCALVDNPRSELIALNNLISVDLCEEKKELARAHIARIDVLYESLGPQIKSRTLSLLNSALYAQKYTTLLDSYHMLSEVLEQDPTHCDALAMRCAVASYQGDLERAAQDLDALRQPTPQRAFLSAEWTRHAELALALGHIIHQHESHRLEPLRAELESIDSSTYSCLIQSCFSDLNKRVSKLLDPNWVLQIHPKGLHARRGSQQDALDLSRSHVTRELLLTLVAHHRTQPGDPCDIQTLFATAWPGQVWNLSARTRLHTAMHRLREKLLGELLLTQDGDGYFIVKHCKIITIDN